MDVREKLVEQLREVAGLTPPICEYQKPEETELFGKKVMVYCKPFEQFQELLREAADYIAHGVTVQEWISVKDRLPEDDDSIHFYGDGRMRCTTVLAYTEYGRIIPKNRLIVKPTGNEYWDTQVTDGWEWARGTEEVTYWMPLPQPPKGE